MSNYQMSTESLKLALQALVEAFPNSVIADLMTVFSDKDVIKFIEVFSGRLIAVPQVDTIYRSYRNKVIIETLLIKDTREVRKQLAGYFGLSTDRVNLIFNNYRYSSKSNRRPIPAAVENTVDSVYKTQSKKLYKEIEQFLSAERQKRSTAGN